MQSATAMLGLRAVAPIHAGSDDLNGVVDLAIQREKHNQWPVVFASSVKGALREAVESHSVARQHSVALFGSKHGSNGGNGENLSAGALLVNDMRIVALPVAALDTAYRWISCPGALARLARDWQRFGADDAHSQARPVLPALPVLVGDAAIRFDGNVDTRMFLREYLFHAQTATPDQAAWLDILAHLFASHTERAELAQRLLLVSDARFTFLAQTATTIAPHIALDANKKTKDGALFYEESLPPETLMLLPLSCENQRTDNAPTAKDELLRNLLSLFPDDNGFFRVGGNETTGMGWFAVHVCQVQA